MRKHFSAPLIGKVKYKSATSTWSTPARRKWSCILCKVRDRHGSPVSISKIYNRNIHFIMHLPRNIFSEEFVQCPFEHGSYYNTIVVRRRTNWLIVKVLSFKKSFSNIILGNFTLNKQRHLSCSNRFHCCYLRDAAYQWSQGWNQAFWLT